MSCNENSGASTLVSTAQTLLCIASKGAAEPPARMGAETCVVEQTVPLAQRTCTHDGLKPLIAISFPSSPWYASCMPESVVSRSYSGKWVIMFRIIQSDHEDEFYTAIVLVMTLQSVVLPGLVLTFRPALGRGYGRPALLRAARFQPAPAVSCLIFPARSLQSWDMHASIFGWKLALDFTYHWSDWPEWIHVEKKKKNWKAAWEMISPFCCCLAFWRALSAFWIKGHPMRCNAIAIQTG